MSGANLIRPNVTSAATPLRAYAPENEEDAETPDDLFRKAEGVARLPTLIPFHNASPCPKRALKSPATIFPLARFKSYRICPHTVSGFNPRPS